MRVLEEGLKEGREGLKGGREVVGARRIGRSRRSGETEEGGRREAGARGRRGPLSMSKLPEPPLSSVCVAGSALVWGSAERVRRMVRLSQYGGRLCSTGYAVPGIAYC